MKLKRQMDWIFLRMEENLQLGHLIGMCFCLTKSLDVGTSSQQNHVIQRHNKVFKIVKINLFSSMERTVI